MTEPIKHFDLQSLTVAEEQENLNKLVDRVNELEQRYERHVHIASGLKPVVLKQEPPTESAKMNARQQFEATSREVIQTLTGQNSNNEPNTLALAALMSAYDASVAVVVGEDEEAGMLTALRPGKVCNALRAEQRQRAGLDRG